MLCPSALARTVNVEYQGSVRNIERRGKPRTSRVSLFLRRCLHRRPVVSSAAGPRVQQEPQSGAGIQLEWSRNGGTLGRDGTESSPEGAQGTMAQTLARIFVHVVFSTKDRALLAYALSRLPAGVCEPRASPCFTLATIRAALRHTIRIRIPEDCGADGPLDFCWPVVVSTASWKTAIELNDLRVVGSIAQTSVCGVAVALQGRRHEQRVISALPSRSTLPT